MEDISLISQNTEDYTSYIQDKIKANVQASVAMKTLQATQDILDTLLDGTFKKDDDIPENSTFSIHV